MASRVEEVCRDQVVGEYFFVIGQGMLHEGRLAGARLALDPEHAVVRGKMGAVAPFLEGVGAEQPVAGAGDGDFDVALARVKVRETERPEAGCAEGCC